LKISEFEWDEGNVLHFELVHGIEPEEAEEVFVHRPLFRKTQKGHYVAMGPTHAGRYLVVIFEKKSKGIMPPTAGWDMNRSEVQYYRRHRRCETVKKRAQNSGRIITIRKTFLTNSLRNLLNLI